MRSWISWRRKKPLPACVETATPRSSSACSNRQSSVPTGASSAMSPKRQGRISPLWPLTIRFLDETAAEISDTVRFGVTQLVGLGVVFVGDVQRGDGDRA